jgi:hypothetical protein
VTDVPKNRQANEVLEVESTHMSPYSFVSLSNELSILRPSSSCSLTRRSGNSAGIIRRGTVPSTSAYLLKSEIPSCSLRKSSSSTHLPLTSLVGDLIMAKIVSENIEGLRSCERSVCGFCVAADSMA